MKRIYFLVPDVSLTEKIVHELFEAGIEERHMHVLAKRNTPLHELPEATLLEKTDFIPAVERGLALGGVAGMLAGLVAIALPTGLVIGGGGLVAIALAGAGIGSWLSGMVGMNVGNTKLRPYEEAIERGEVLLMVDTPKARVEEIHQLVLKHHPEAEFEGTEPTLPPII